MAALLNTTRQNAILHLRSILPDGELAGDSVIKEYLRTAADAKACRTKLHSLEAILAVGCRVRSPCGVQLCRWAASTLKAHLVRGFVMDDGRAKDPASSDACALCATIQNRMLHAVTGRTAAELIHERSDPDRPNMGLTTWKGADRGRPLRKADVGTARNYLGEAEIRKFSRIAEAFLSTAELRAARRQPMRLCDWEQALEDLLAMSELPKLRGAGSVSAAGADRVARERYNEFDAKQKEAERQVPAETDDIEELKCIADTAKAGKTGLMTPNAHGVPKDPYEKAISAS